MEMEKQDEEMKKKFPVLHRKIGNLESQLTPFFSKSPKTEEISSFKIVSEEVNQNLHYIKSLLTAEMAANGRDEARHLARMACTVQFLQSACRAWSNPRSISSFMESSEAPRCSYTDPDSVHVDEEENEVDNCDDDNEEREVFPLSRFKISNNPMYVFHDDDDDDQDGSVELGEVSQNEEDREEEETVGNDSETEEMLIKVEECIHDNFQNEYEESRITEDSIRVDYDQKEETTTKAEEDSDDGYENDVRTHYCYRVIFWGGLIGMGIISAMAGFSDFPEYHSPAMFLTPT